MRENFENYKKELDRVRLTRESKRALAESLGQRSQVRRTAARRPLRARYMLAAAAVASLLAALSVVAVAQVVGEPTLGNSFTGDSAGYDQSSGLVGRMAENDGWTAAITDCVGDDFHSFLGVEITAPEGTVLDAASYEIHMDNEYGRQGVSGTLKGFCYSLPDSDPTDNRIRLIYDWYTTGGESNHVQMRVKLTDLVENRGYLWEEQNWDRPMVKEGVWDFGWIDISYADNAIHLAPMLELPCEEAEIVLEEVVLSPVGIYLRTNITTPYPIALGDWFQQNILSTVRLRDVDGNEIPFEDGYLFGGLSGTYFSFTNHIHFMNNAGAEGPVELRVVDLERIASVSVIGVEIPVHG